MAKINRRDFLKAGAAATTAAAVYPTVGAAMELKLGGEDFHQLRTFHPRKRTPYLCTLCPYFDGGFCYEEDGEILKVEGDPDHIASRGKFCGKGLGSFYSAADPDRIVAPLKRTGPRGAGQWEEISWDEAIAEVSGKLTTALDADPNSIHLNEGSFKDGGTLRFMDTLGSSSVVRSRVSSISNAAKKGVLQSTYGVDFMLPDFENTKYVLNFGCNIMETALPLAQRLADGIVNSRLKLVTFDVRMSNTAGRSDEWLPVFPGSDGIVALAMANVIIEHKLENTEFIHNWTNTSAAELAQQLAPYTPAKAAKASGIPAKTIKRIAIEFAKSKPATVFSQNGVTYHQGGVDAEAACQLLSIITGNIDIEGGNCLPRQFDIAKLQPAPEQTGSTSQQLNHSFPFEVKNGNRKVSILFNHLSNPAYSAPAASIWKEVLKDESLIPFSVDFSPFMSETAELADIILPDVVAIERHDLGSSPIALQPWLTMSVPGVKPRGKAMDVRETLKKIIDTIDADGGRGMKQFWAFSNAKDWVKQEVEGTEGTDKKSYKKLKKGSWPKYGKIDLDTRKIVNDGNPIPAKFKTFEEGGFATPSGKIEVAAPSWTANPRLEAIKPNEFVLSTYKVVYHSLSRTTNIKPLTEIWHSNPLWINREIAQKVGIKDGELVRVTTEAGYLVTKAWLTQGIHPQVVGISTSVGRTTYGRVAQADPDAAVRPSSDGKIDVDIDANLWWRDAGINPNDIIPIAIDPASGVQAWNDTVVTVTPAEAGDKYGDIRVDNAKHETIYKKLLG
ncbi:Anaerobic dehydrogenases, typically selenocysteine-containing [hydrothermal vent metagenome]|uniref:Anaerobic dehydrogenases, typically selenocysteine-containing n=1 Tax=hydrothermal vent metagenome TaxID=652676 RepID=A0A3B1B4J6_9ZZZZ